MMVKMADVVTASTHDERKRNSDSVVMATEPTHQPGLIFPVPTAGRRSDMKLRIGRARPRKTSMAMMTRNGTATFHPGVEIHRVAWDSSMPMMRAPIRVSQNDANPPTRAAESAGTMVSANAAGFTLDRGIRSTPARPASAAPSVQFTAATMRGDQPSADAASWFSPTADVANPNRENRDQAHKRTVNNNAMANSQSRSAGRMTDSLSLMLPVGRKPSTKRCWSP